MHHKEYGAFIQFPGGLRGLAPIRYLTDRRAPDGTDWSQVYPAGATVEAKVVEVGLPENRRFLVSLRMLDTYVSAEAQYTVTAVKQAERYLEECRWICANGESLSLLISHTLHHLAVIHDHSYLMLGP